MIRLPTFCGSTLTAAVLSAGLGTASAAAQPPAAQMPASECTVHVGYDRDTELSGYLLPTSSGPSTCIPLTTTATKPPTDYKGDFYVDEFSDAKLLERWRNCQAREKCRGKIDKHVAERRPPNRDRIITNPHTLWLLGAVPDEDVLDLKQVRRPGFFAQDPWHEPIATLDAETYTVEFTAPAEPFERLNLHSDHAVKLRGWYIRGAGVADGHGGRTRSLIILSGGGGGRIAAIEDPTNTLYEMKKGKSDLHHFPDDKSGTSGEREWRNLIVRLHDAGFDILNYDRRGVGLSTGFSDTNTLQQGRDLLGVVGTLRTGAGLRILTPEGTALAGKPATAALLGTVSGDRLPILLAGSSRGTMATGWAMARNFDRACDYDLPAKPCGAPVGYRNIKGAIQISDFSAGPGYITEHTDDDDEERPLFIAGSETALHISFFPNSSVLASIPKWPALFIGRGLYDYAESLEGAIDAYDREPGLKELVVVRGPHPLEVWPKAERDRMIDRMIAFATSATFDRKTAPGGRLWSDAKQLAGTTADLWEPSTQPR